MVQEEEEKISRLVVRLIAVFWIVMKIMSYKLWMTDRLYPLVPLLDLPSIVHTGLFFLFFPLCGWLIFNPSNRYIMWVLIASEIILTTGDQSRIQPWNYQYMFTLFVIAGNNKDKQKAFQAIVLITAATYIYSGIQKVNSGFLDFIWSFHILKRFAHVPDYIILNQYVRLAGYALPIIEISGGVCLLFKKTMKFGALLTISMHIFILWFMGPLGINYNSVVWPWNVQMVIFLNLFFIKKKIQLQPAMFFNKVNFITAICWILLPFIGLFGYWDKFLSAGMYSGRGALMQFYFEDRKVIPKELEQFAFYSATDSSARIVLTDWCMRELNVAAVTEPRVLKHIVQQLNERYENQNVHFELTPAKRKRVNY